MLKFKKHSKNILYLGYLGVETEEIWVQYPDPPPNSTSNMISHILEIVIDSLKARKEPIRGCERTKISNTSVFVCAEDDLRNAYVLVTLGTEYPTRFARSLLTEFVRKIEEEKVELDVEDLDHMLHDDFMFFMKELFSRYENVVEEDPATLVKFKIDNAMENVGEGIMQVIDNCISITMLEEKSQVLNEQAIIFNREAANLKKFYRRENLLAIIGISVIAIAIIIYIITIIVTRKGS